MNLFNSKNILRENRHSWIDYCRGISIILVSYRHCYEGMIKAGIQTSKYPVLEYINLFFFGFRMPLFFIISGIFINSSLQKTNLGDYTKKRANSLLYPMLVWGVIQITLQIIFSKYANSSVTAISYLYLLVDPRSTGQFWYLNALFFVGVIYATIKTKTNIKNHQNLLLGLLLYFSSNYINNDELYLGFIIDIFKYYLFFSIGDIISEFIMSEKAAVFFSSKKLLLGLIPLFITVQSFFTYYNLANKNDYFIETNMPVFYLLVAISGAALIMSISFMLSKSNKLSSLRIFGHNSISIFCMQIIVMSVFRQFCMKFLFIQNVPILTIMILTSGLIIPVILHNLFLRYKMWWLFSVNKPV